MTSGALSARLYELRGEEGRLLVEFLRVLAELQQRLNHYAGVLPDSVQQRLATRYAELFGVYLKNIRTVRRVTFWGVGDGDSCLNNWPMRGRTSYPLLFDRNGAPKPAFDAIIRLVQQRVTSN